tara:strand:- start:5719 stop:6213 length:495 start_codon:yes stop_codon:yes gene_type:complete
MTIDHICERIHSYKTVLVEITGGEPLDKPEVIPLIERLCNDGNTVLIETSGTIDITPIDARAHVIMDVKCPGSGMTKYMNWENINALQCKDEVKFVIADRADYDWAISVIEQYEIDGRCPILFSPVFGVLKPSILSDWILQSSLKVRVQLQIHKYIWSPLAKGV